MTHDTNTMLHTMTNLNKTTIATRTPSTRSYGLPCRERIGAPVRTFLGPMGKPESPVTSFNASSQLWSSANSGGKVLLRRLRLLLTAPQPPRLTSLLASAEATGATSTAFFARLIPSLLSLLLALVLLRWWPG